jgi:uncharacterized membrane protein
MQKEKKEKKPLDMTSDEAMKYLFSQEVVDELKEVANPPKKTAQVVESEKDNDCDSLPLQE